MANNIGRYCEVIGHTVKGRVWEVIADQGDLLVLCRFIKGRMGAMFIARLDQITNLY